MATKLAVHESVCPERWKQASERLGRIAAVLAAIVLLLLVGEGCVIAVLRRLLGRQAYPAAGPLGSRDV